MSQYIRVNHSLTNCQESNNVLKGLVSKICSRDSSSSLLKNQPHRRYMQQKISIRVQHEQEVAHLRHNQSLMINYMKLKHKLAVYGRSKSCKLDQLFDKDPARLSLRDSIEEAKRISIKPGKIQREIVIAKKYNHQLAIKAAILRQIEQLQEMKRRRMEAINRSLDRSLSLNISQLCRDALPRKTQNPVLISSHSTKLRKKKKKPKIP